MLISLVVPTLNEAANLPALAARIDAALTGTSYEIRIIDDNSHDDTRKVCEQLAAKYPLHLTVRTQPKNGLSGAVLAGMADASGEFLVVMDADLQHPPEKILSLIAPIQGGQADFVIGSRYVPGGTTQETWGVFRRINSRAATGLARPFSGKVRDPMSGFFALRRSTFEAARDLTPLGYKIGLELMCKCRVQHVVEVPIDFGSREHGQSKLSLKQQFRYLEHLSRLYDFQYPSVSPMAKFLIVAAIGWLFGLAIVLTNWSLERPVLLNAFAWACTLGVTMIFFVRYIRTQREFILDRRPWRGFFLISVLELIAVLSSSAWMVRRVNGLVPTEFWSIAFFLSLVMRYILRKELVHDVRGLRRSIRE